jgi:putative transposase
MNFATRQCMPRKKPNYNPEHPIHITARCINQMWFDLPLEEVWIIFSNYLYFISHAFNIEIISFVLMNNHFHLLVHDSNFNISKAMCYFMREVSKSITIDTKRVNQTFGGPFHPTVIGSTEHLLNVYKYIYQNPLRAKIVSRAEEYKFSTLHGILGLSQATIPVTSRYDNLFPLVQDTSHTLSWLNHHYDDIEIDLIRKGLRSHHFKIGKKRSCRTKIDLPSI